MSIEKRREELENESTGNWYAMNITKRTALYFGAIVEGFFKVYLETRGNSGKHYTKFEIEEKMRGK